MPREVIHPFGRDRAIDLVRTCLTRPEQGGILQNRRTPVLIFTGSRGSGKTTLLAELARRLDQQTPFARVDFQTVDATTGQDVLTALVFEFNRKCGRYGALGFPRFITGQLVVGQQLTLGDRKVARAQVRTALEAYRKVDQLRQFLRETAPAVLSTVSGATGTPGVSEAGRYLPDLALSGLLSWPGSRKVVLGTGQDWFGHQDRNLELDAIDVLVDLNRKANADNDADSQREATELLWAAFLADLNHGFRRGRRANERSFNCLVLLDNVDTSAGLTFLEDLVEARRKRAAYRREESDPLTVVATSRGTLIERVTEISEPAGSDDWLGRWWFPATLCDLTLDDVANMVAAVELGEGSRRRVTAMVHQFTVGHPGSTRLILDAISERPANQTDLVKVLAGREPGLKPEMSVEQALRHRFLQSFPPDAIDDLVTCAAARDIHEAMRLVTHSRLLARRLDGRPAIFISELWTGTDARSGKVLQPPLRRLLLRQLAERDKGQVATWKTVHDWLVKDCADNNDEAGKLYHMLAVGDVEPAARRLAELLPTVEATAWLELLDAVVDAPSAMDHQLAPIGEVARLNSWSDPLDLPLAAVGRLVTALWLLADPLTDSRRRSLHREAAHDYDQIAPYPVQGLEWLRARAERHRAESEMWE